MVYIHIGHKLNHEKRKWYKSSIPHIYRQSSALKSCLAAFFTRNNIMFAITILSCTLAILNEVMGVDTRELSSPVPALDTLALSVVNADKKTAAELLKTVIDPYAETYESFDVLSRFDQALPPMWAEVPSLTTEHFKQDETGSLIVDAWNYLHRMALYKHLIENIQHCQWDSPSKLNPSNIIWGLPLQHGWQFASGRLNIPLGNTTTAIDPKAWWGDMNYYLSILPYLGAVSAGMAPRISILETPDPSKFCVSYADCPNDIEPWRMFFDLVNSTSEDCETEGVNFSISNTPIADRLDFNITNGLEDLLHSLWSAHLHSINAALLKFQNELELMPAPEARFGESWATIVDYIAASYFLCDLRTTDVLQNLLPPRVLQDGDKAPMIADMSRLQNRAVVFIEGLDRFTSATHGVSLKMW